MIFENRDQLIAGLRSTWSEGDEFRLSISIIELIENNPATLHIPYAHFQRLAVRNSINPLSIQPVVEYLAGADSQILDLCAELVESDDSVHTLNIEDLAMAKEGIHPFTGRYDETVSDKIFIFFSPSTKARRVLWKK